MYKKVAPMFLVDDVGKVVDFYKRTFRAKLFASLPKDPPFEWASVTLNDVEFMFWKKGAALAEYTEGLFISEKPSNLIIYLYVEDVDQLFESVKDDVKILMEPKEQFYGIREFTISDPFGIILTFAQVKK